MPEILKYLLVQTGAAAVEYRIDTGFFASN